MQLVFYLLISMKSCYNLKLRFFDGYGQTFPKFPKQHIAMPLKKQKKEGRDEVDLLDADKHQSFLQIDFNN